jgi:putative peptidoglycan lipid II flippase
VPPRALRGGIPRHVEAIVLRALRRSPDDRHLSAESMKGALERAIMGEPTLPRGIPPIRDVPIAPAGAGGVFRSWMLAPTLLVLLAVAAIVAGLALGRLQFGGPLGVRGATKASPGTPSSPAPRALHVASASDFDPQGDGSENPSEVPLALDGDPATAWMTNHYRTADFGGLKDGLGLWIGLGSTRRVASITIRSLTPGWAFQLQSSPGEPTSPSPPLRTAEGSTTFRVGPSGTVTVKLRPATTSGILIWITQLAPTEGRFGYGASVAEVRVAGFPAGGAG